MVTNQTVKKTMGKCCRLTYLSIFQLLYEGDSKGCQRNPMECRATNENAENISY